MLKEQALLLVAAAIISSTSCGSDGLTIFPDCDLSLRSSQLTIELEPKSFFPDEEEVDRSFKVGLFQEGMGDVVFLCSVPETPSDDLWFPTVLGENSNWDGETDPERLATLAGCTKTSLIFTGEPATPRVTVEANSKVGGGEFTPEYVPYPSEKPEHCGDGGGASSATIVVEAAVDQPRARRTTENKNGKGLCDVADVDYDEESSADKNCSYPDDLESNDSETADEMSADLQLALLSKLEQQGDAAPLITGGPQGFRPEVVKIVAQCPGEGGSSGGSGLKGGGMILAGDAILTAGHVFADICAPRGEAFQGTITVTRKVTSGQNAPYTAVYIGSFTGLVDPDQATSGCSADHDVAVVVLDDRMDSYYRGRFYSSYSSPPTSSSRKYYAWGYEGGNLEWADNNIASPGGWTLAGGQYFKIGSAGLPEEGDSGGPIGFMSKNSSVGPDAYDRYVMTGPIACVNLSGTPFIPDVSAERMADAWTWLDNYAGSRVGCTFHTGCSSYTSYGWPMRRCSTSDTCE